MTTHPENALQRLGFNRIRQRLARFCYSEAAHGEALQIQPSTDAGAIRERLTAVQEMRELLALGTPPFEALPDITNLLANADVEGLPLPARAFVTLKRWLKTVRKLVKWLQKAEDAEVLATLLEELSFDFGLADDIRRVVTDEGYVKPTASSALKKIRQTQSQLQGQLRRVMNQELQEARDKGWSDADEIALRNGRLVLPVKAAAQSNIQGFVQDVSGTGKTVFIEPVSALQGNNRLRELQIAEQREIERILQELTDKVRPQLPMIRQWEDFARKLDGLQAAAQLAELLHASVPELVDDNSVLELHTARNPELMLTKSVKEVVPASIHLSRGTPMLLISGPNAGGKSVALKTVGLLQLMLQCGLPVPAEESSRMPVINQVFVDIGDDQSIQNDLSTYTSHLTRMQAVLEHADAQSLVLIDEFGTGTDPSLGGPIAEAILEKFVQRGLWGIITTHYSNLKEMGEREEGIANAAMAFDRQQLSPTYIIEQGLPGSSFALEIAERVGIPAKILSRATRKVGRKRTATEELISDLQRRQMELEKREIDMRIQQEKLEQKLYNNQQKEERLKRDKTKILNEARREAKGILKTANKTVENTIREIREQQADKAATKAARRELDQQLKQVEVQPIATEKGDNADAKADSLEVGDRVQMENSDMVGEIEDIQGKQARVAVGNLTLTAKLDSLQKVDKTPETHSKRGKQVKKSMAEVATRIDLRGLRAEEALPRVDTAIND